MERILSRPEERLFASTSVGCGTCSEFCPSVSELDEEEGKAVAILAERSPEDFMKKAVTLCRAECIHWEK